MSHEDVKPNPAQLDGQPTLRVTLASPGMSEPITIRAKSSTAVSKCAILPPPLPPSSRLPPAAAVSLLLHARARAFFTLSSRPPPSPRLINAFANNQGINAATIRLVTPEGERMRPQQTLGDYGIEDNDRLDVLIEQIGGH